ncbi:pyruvate,water dikinase [Arthrobacter ginsengisoli]|uniref:Pyruvate,water dikinase n=1 Tax=Arthrobacter ginsengisoli TaxID=1356565 RepID=A0ABU1UIS8_9MICC|nr:PEP-utilizing enzyme [Arthrobacter ginsengisoli]MDR7085058.1 pyruvate,water dikinase [Arthrobacter ginsengisoli]
MAMLPPGGTPRGRAGHVRPPAWLLPVLLQLNPRARRRLRAAQRASKEDLPYQTVNRWYSEYLPAQRARLDEFKKVDVAALDPESLADHLRRCKRLLQQSAEIHYEVVIPPLFSTAELAKFCRKELGWTFERVLGLLAGTSNVSSEPARELARIAGDGDPSRLRDRLDQYRQDFGLRSLSAELSDPTLAERPQLLELQLRALNHSALAREKSELTDRRHDLAREARRRLMGRKLTEFDRLLGRALRAYPLRDDNSFFTFDSPFAFMRYAVLEAGHRMVKSGTILALDDVFYCEVDEVIAWLDTGGMAGGGGPGPSKLMPLVRRRPGERTWSLANPGPATYGAKPGKPPSLRWLPRGPRAFMECVSFAMEHVLAETMSERTVPGDAARLTGVAASAGTYSGPVKVILSESAFGRIQRGDVLVCPSTRPSWSVVFPSLGAIITDSGGALSHPAIIAREHRIPAVVATGCATSLLQDGQRVTVDGAAGTVTF